ncbi:MAG TPA: hypothetical protein PLB05_01750 [Candidatus Omnitrophota bacterium]|jgi:hypothetical protein|nr:hypothetical protein [Candidatus Omnitrophota bacterium]HPN55975.1 hypothetical protein [Candidatus Omnitrophota bacterium]
MNNFIVLGIIGLVILIFVKKDTSKSADAKKYLKAMAKFLGQGQDLQGDDPCPQRIDFMYAGKPFVFEHIEESVSGGKKRHRACLKGETPLPLTLNFSERSRTSIRVSLDSLLDVTNPQALTHIPLPKGLGDFELITNDRLKAIELLSDERILKTFEAFKNRDAVGHPVMSLEIVEGFVILHFHPPGGLKPSLLNLQLNVSSIEEYIKKILPLILKMTEMKGRA